MALQQVSAGQAGYWMAFPMSSPPLVDAIYSPKGKDGDLSMSIDDAPVKVRKPYTITKQRERWTEDEHQKFLDALKLHGRAWRRIEEHIGTKTAVQIRSHAQKFFSKLEREASSGGPLTIAGSGEIEIPPPRPKRKPSHPYPKKASGAFSGSPSFEDDCKSPPAVHSAFTPLESGTGTSLSKTLSKKIESSAASLRLFGQTFVPGSDKVEADTELMESTGSPRSQISVETGETSGISPLVSNTASGVWDQNVSVSKPQEIATTLSGTNSQLCKAIAEWETSLIAMHTPKIDHSNENNAPNVSSAYECRPDASCYTPWQPSSFSLGGHHLSQFSAGIPALWQGLVPPSTHSTSEDVNTAAAIAAATYAVASAWQVIQGALANASNDSNTSIVYSPIAMLAAAREPISISRAQSPDAYAHEHAKTEQGGTSSGSGNEDEVNSVHGEESTAECCSSLTDTSRLSSYESNDEGVPAKKCRRKFYDDSVHLDKEAHEVENPSLSSEGLGISHQNNGAVAIHSRSTNDHMDGPSNKARIENSSVSKSLQPENDTAKISVHISMDADQPIDLIIQACRLNSPLETGKESPKDSSDSNKEKEWLNMSSHDDSGSQIGGSGTCIESEHLFMIKAGTTLSSRYSGVGFVPYKKSMRVESSSKHED